MDDNKLIRIPLNQNKEMGVFICILTSFYSDYFRELLLAIPNDNLNDNHNSSLIFIIKRLITRYYYENKGTINFYKIITPEIILLKFLNETNYIKMRRFMVLNRKMEVPLTFLCDIHHSLNLNCLKMIRINDNPNFYLNTNNVGSSSLSGILDSSTSKPTIGWGADSADYYFNGNIYISQIYNRALSDSEIQQNYNATKTRFGL